MNVLVYLKGRDEPIEAVVELGRNTMHEVLKYSATVIQIGDLLVMASEVQAIHYRKYVK